MSHNVVLSSYVLDPTPGGVNIVRPIECEDEVQYPRQGLTVLYGGRFRREALGALARLARTQGRWFVEVRITVRAHRPMASRHWFGDVDGKSVVDLHRLTPDAEAEMASLWRKYMRDDSVSPKDIQAMSWEKSRFIADHPQYLDRLHEEPRFRGVDLFIWRTRQQGRTVARATIYNRHNITAVKAISAQPLPVTLPACP